MRISIYTSNAVEAVHRHFCKLTKAKGSFASENGLLKLLYAGILKASERLKKHISLWTSWLIQSFEHSLSCKNLPIDWLSVSFHE